MGSLCRFEHNKDLAPTAVPTIEEQSLSQKPNEGADRYCKIIKVILTKVSDISEQAEWMFYYPQAESCLRWSSNEAIV